MKDMIPVFREGSLAPLNYENLAPRWCPSPLDTYEIVQIEGDFPSCLRKLQVGQKMLLPGSDYIRAANAARNASIYGMHMRIHKSARDGGIWIGRRA